MVMFLVLVLFLAMNVNQKQEQVESDQQAVTATRTEIAQAKVDAENNLLLVEGAVPGPNGGFVVVRETNKVGPN